MTAILTTIKDKTNGNTLYPVTKTNAVSDSNGTDLDSLLAGKQDTLTFDTTPTSGSSNPVTSGGVYSYARTPRVGTGSVSSYSSKPVTVTSSKVQFRIGLDGFVTVYGYVRWSRTNATDSLGVVINFGITMDNTDYAITITPRDTSTNNYHTVGCYVLSKTTTTATVLLQNVNNGTYNAGFNFIVQGF